MSSPDYLICLACETPCYQFEIVDGEIAEAFCAACGNDESEQFLSEEDMDALVGAGGPGEGH